MKRNNLSRLLAALLAAAVACTAFSGCTRKPAPEQSSDTASADIGRTDSEVISSDTGSEPESSEPEKQPAYESTLEKTYIAPDTNTEDTLQVLCSMTDREAFNIAITKFRAKYPKVQVNLNLYDTIDGDCTDVKEWQEKLMDGIGADIVLVDSSDFAQVSDYRKVQQQGVYLDLVEFFDRDPDWDWSGYSKAVVDGMKMGDKQYLMPLYFTLPILVTTDALLAQSGVDLNNCYNGIGLMQELTRCAEEVKAGKHDDYSVIDINRFYHFHEMFDVNPVSFTNEACIVNWTDDFDSALIAYDALAQQLDWFSYSKEKEQQQNMIWNQSYYERLIKNHSYFIIGDPMGFTFDNGLNTLAIMGYKPQIIPIYTADGSGITADVFSAVGISAGCRNPELAYEFIKCLLSDEAQGKLDQYGGYRAAWQPINKTAAGYASSFNVSKFSETVTDVSGNEVEINSKMYADQFIDLADQVVYSYMYCYTVPDAESYFYPYFERSLGLSDCYQEAEKQLELYATE